MAFTLSAPAVAALAAAVQLTLVAVSSVGVLLDNAARHAGGRAVELRLPEARGLAPCLAPGA
jgi:hypothetical protein